MKKLLMVVAAALGAVVVQKKMKENKAEQDLWREATAPSSSSPTTPSSISR